MDRVTPKPKQPPTSTSKPAVPTPTTAPTTDRSAPPAPAPAPAPAPGGTPPLSGPPQQPLGRIPVLNVRPCVDGGARPAKSVVNEEFDVVANVFREGHDAVNASVVLIDPDGVETTLPMECTNVGLSIWEATVAAPRTDRGVRLTGRFDPVTVPAEEAAGLDAVLGGGVLRAADLPLPADAALSLVRRLLDAGVCVPA